MIGESAQREEKAAEFVASQMDKPVIAFSSRKTAPPGRRMGHAGRSCGRPGTAAGKIECLQDHGIDVAPTPAASARLLKKAMACRRGHGSRETFAIIKPDAVRPGAPARSTR